MFEIASIKAVSELDNAVSVGKGFRSVIVLG